MPKNLIKFKKYVYKYPETNQNILTMLTCLENRVLVITESQYDKSLRVKYVEL